MHPRTYIHTRCGPYFGTTVEAMQFLTHQTEKKHSNLQKRDKKILCRVAYGVCGVCRRENFLTLSPSYKQSPKNRENCLCPTVLQLRWVISTWWDENMTLFVFSACYQIHWNWFCGRKQTKNAKIRKGAFFREGCFDRKGYVSNTENKRCSQQVLQLRCSSSYSIKFYTWC